MAVVITSTTSSQEAMDHAVSENWREPFVPKEAEAKPDVEETKADVPESVNSESIKEADKGTEKGEEAAKPQPKGHKGAGAQKRIDKLTARNAFLESRLAELETKVKPAEEKQEPQGPKEPKYQDFNGDIEKFLAARDAWKDGEAIRQAHAEREQAINTEYNKRISEAKGEIDDWEEVVAGNNTTIPIPCVNTIKKMDNGPQVAYYLAKNTEEAKELMNMDIDDAIIAVKDISRKLSGAAGIATVVKTQSKLKVKPPEPISPVGASATRGSIPLDQLSVRDYIKVRNKQERESRSR